MVMENQEESWKSHGNIVCQVCGNPAGNKTCVITLDISIKIMERMRHGSSKYCYDEGKMDVDKLAFCNQ